MSAKPRYETEIRIRCSRETKIRFKQLSARFKNYEETLKKLLDFADKHKYLFEKEIEPI